MGVNKQATQLNKHGFWLSTAKNDYLPDEIDFTYDGCVILVHWWRGPEYQSRRIFVPADLEYLFDAYDFALDYLYETEGVENLDYKNCDCIEVNSI